MTASVKQHESKEIRGRILKALDLEYPRAMSLQMLGYALQSARYNCDPDQIRAHLAYLEQKGYVFAEDVGLKDLNLRRNMISLTAKGKDLVEGNIPDDPGVILYG
ncbi:MAG: hypothetical protein AB9917_22015 [Negativicutes bacterium]